MLLWKHKQNVFSIMFNSTNCCSLPIIIKLEVFEYKHVHSEYLKKGIWLVFENCNDIWASSVLVDSS